MLRNYFRTAFRSLRNNPFLSLIHIVGLAIGVTACALIFQYVHFEYSYDKFHENAENIYRVPIRYSEGFGPFPRTAANHPAAGPALYQEFPTIRSFVRVLHPSNIGANIKLTAVSRNGDKISASEDAMYMTDSSFFDVFTYEFLAGNSSTALDDPNSIVLTESMAKRYFGTTDVVGRVFDLNGDRKLAVTGVIEDVPENSHLQFDALFSDSFLYRDGVKDSWVWPEFYTYVLLEDGADPRAIEAGFPELIEKHMTQIHLEHGFQTYFSLQPLTDIHLKSECSNEPTPPGNSRAVNFLSLLGLIVLALAWINYLNLASARAANRAKEVGVRKVVGAQRSQLIAQFIVEAGLICTVSIILGLIAANLLLPIFSSLVEKNIGDSLINFRQLLLPRNLLFLLLSTVISGILAGIYPALVLSSFRPAQVLKGSHHRTRQGVNFRRGLVSVQMALSILLIGGTLLVSDQLSFMNTQDLGYNKEQILVIRAPVITDSLVLAAAKAFPTRTLARSEVNSVTRSSEVPGKLIAMRNQTKRPGKLDEEGTHTYLQSIDENYMTTFEVPVLAGRNFATEDSANPFDSLPTRILINETLSEAYGFESPEQAVGQQVLYKLGPQYRPAEVTGVVADYHQRSLREAYDPILYFFPSYSNWRYFSVGLNSGDLSKTIAGIEEIYKDHFPDGVFEHFFLDEYFDRQYQSDQQFARVCRAMALLAIFVAGLGFLALSILVINQRRKEIGVRKILGAKTSRIMLLISKEFILLLLIAQVLALPFLLYLGQRWLDNFAFSVGLGWQIFVLPILLFVLIILGILGVQLVRSSALDPVHALRQDS